jgi:DNA-directed RNA polymerase subunit RPC12/RpoP
MHDVKQTKIIDQEDENFGLLGLLGESISPDECEVWVADSFWIYEKDQLRSHEPQFDLNIEKYVTTIVEDRAWKSNSRIYGQAVEDWIDDNLACPNCGGKLEQYLDNEPAKDHFCHTCSKEYQTKSSSSSLTYSDGSVKNVMGAEYKTTLNSYENGSPDFLLVKYNPAKSTIEDVIFAPAQKLPDNFVIPRKPLSEGARRAGWQGCYLNFDEDWVFRYNLKKDQTSDK